MLVEILISALRPLAEQLRETGEALNPRLSADLICEAIRKLEAAEADAAVGRKWRENSSLEAWFPYTAKQVTQLEAESAELRGTIASICEYLGCEPDNVLDAASKVHRAIEDAEGLRARVLKAERENEQLRITAQDVTEMRAKWDQMQAEVHSALEERNYAHGLNEALQARVADQAEMLQAYKEEMARVSGALSNSVARVAELEGQWMPILGTCLAMPMRVLNEHQARYNHGQSLGRLKERGGVSLSEAVAIAQKLKIRQLTTAVSLEILTALAALPAAPKEESHGR